MKVGKCKEPKRKQMQWITLKRLLIWGKIDVVKVELDQKTIIRVESKSSWIQPVQLLIWKGIQVQTQSIKSMNAMIMHGTAPAHHANFFTEKNSRAPFFHRYRRMGKKHGFQDSLPSLLFFFFYLKRILAKWKKRMFSC